MRRHLSFSGWNEHRQADPGSRCGAGSGRLLYRVNSRLYLVLAFDEAQVAAGMPVSLAAPRALLLGAGLVGPAVFFLPHPLGEDAQGEVTRRGPARFCGKSA